MAVTADLRLAAKSLRRSGWVWAAIVMNMELKNGTRPVIQRRTREFPREMMG
jgi:hypothetical protein